MSVDNFEHATEVEIQASIVIQALLSQVNLSAFSHPPSHRRNNILVFRVICQCEQSDLNENFECARHMLINRKSKFAESWTPPGIMDSTPHFSAFDYDTVVINTSW